MSIYPENLLLYTFETSNERESIVNWLDAVVISPRHDTIIFLSILNSVSF